MFTPRYYQTEAINALFEHLANQISDEPVIALPTGTGKSLVNAGIVTRMFNEYSGARVMCLTHVKELIKQNSEKLVELWPDAPMGIYSAGLKRRQLNMPITFAGIASVVDVIEQFGHIDVVSVDEAHLLSGKSDSMYGHAFKVLRQRNPRLKIIKLTATPYRLGMGLIADRKDFCFDNTGLHAFNKLIYEGFLCPPVTKKTATKLDLSNISVGSNGDFNMNQVEATIDTNDINYNACKEMVQYGYDRVAWLVFAAGVKHAEHIAALLNSFGISSVAVHSKMGEGARDKAISDYKLGRIRCLVNNNVLTTGFDHPPIDFIGMLRPTMSTGLWVQMLGRGTRPSPETMKLNCLCLDFARNTPRLGPINDPIIPRPKGAGKPGAPPIRICDNCGVYNHASARTCTNCGYEFPTQLNITQTAGNDELLVSDVAQIEWLQVSRVYYAKFTSQSNVNYLKITYVCAGMKKGIDQLVALETGGFQGIKAREWWCLRMGVSEAPPSVDEALKWTARLRTPKRIEVHINKKYPEILDWEF